jgi:DNA-binding PucR family transcriptional regulator
MVGDPPSPRTIELIGDIAERLLADLEPLAAQMDAEMARDAPVLSADAAIAAERSASNRAVTRRLLTSLVRRDGVPPTADVPPEALDIARTVVRRGIDFDVLFEAYRHGQNMAWRAWLTHAADVVGPGPELFDVLSTSSELIFGYVDQILARVLAEAQREREEVLGGALARRTETVRLILDGAPLDEQRASRQLGYELARRHTALVVWAEPLGEVQGALESAAMLLAKAAGAHRPLILPAGTATLWAWVGTDHDPAAEALRDAMGQARPNIRVAVGPTRAGITGFRRTHAAALALQYLLAGHEGGVRLAPYHDLEVTVLAAQDQERAAEFVVATLGPLAADEVSAARLRETLRVYLDEAENAPRAAQRLHTHRNTVLQRVARATELLGHRPGERRLALELALELAHQLGPRTLTRT